jgi:hypothetical protein
MCTFKVCWVAHLPKERANILPSLLQHVHFPLMSMDEVSLNLSLVSCIFLCKKMAKNSAYITYNLKLMKALPRIFLLIKNLGFEETVEK